MKRLITAINTFMIQVILFFVYFVAIGIAAALYRLQKASSKNHGLWNKKNFPANRDYFLSPY